MSYDAASISTHHTKPQGATTMKLNIRSVYPNLIALAIAAGISVLLAACGGGSGGGGARSGLEFSTIGGNVSGLSSGAFVVLSNNGGTGGNVVTVTANGTFTFATPVASGSSYAVTVATQPVGQICTVGSGSGTGVAANISTVRVVCKTPLPAKYAYVANLNGKNVSQYTIGVGGALAPMSMATVAAGTQPYSVTVDPTGKYAYVTNSGDRSISQYTIGAGGALAPMTTATIVAGTNPYLRDHRPNWPIRLCCELW